MKEKKRSEMVSSLIDLGYTEKEAVQIENKVNNLKAELLKGEVKFSYVKTNGDIRDAVETLEHDVVAPLFDFDKPSRNITRNPLQFRYYDIEAEGWRSFNVINLI